MSATAEPFDSARAFSTAQAVAAGIPASRLRGKEFRRLAKGKYVSAERPASALLAAEAALLGHPDDAFASHTTAAEVYRMPVPHDDWQHVSVLDPASRRRRLGVRSHVASAQTQVLTVKGVRVAAPAYVFIQLASILTLVELVVVGDYLVGKDWYSPAQLVGICAASDDAHAARALAAARFVREGVDSPMESRLRMLLVLAGLPEPKVNHLLRDEYGVVVRRLDLSYPGVRVIVEYDGRQHADDAKQHDHDIYRREELDDGEWRIVVVTAAGVYKKPEETLLRVRKVLRARGVTGLPTQFKPEWRRHFPGSGAR